MVLTLMYGLVRLGTVMYGLVRSCTVRYGLVQFGTVFLRYGTLRLRLKKHAATVFYKQKALLKLF